jgi:hypothetical protein
MRKLSRTANLEFMTLPPTAHCGVLRDWWQSSAGLVMTGASLNVFGIDIEVTNQRRPLLIPSTFLGLFSAEWLKGRNY